eukprot:CAMPEP_0170421280 /NCGR_PEP_ID=MMETSP0117_2-20130122/35811_1 /TAXON_ID=400756 /ORGANISM="Durinskia baltica, Strain CSIRO CS-38" /LENGTH=80 /DNA_ID=CAMNT_0010679813 /DNA_START=90 /DNA_END=332 /DNA_ORIENTATION=+
MAAATCETHAGRTMHSARTWDDGTRQGQCTTLTLFLRVSTCPPRGLSRQDRALLFERHPVIRLDADHHGAGRCVDPGDLA